MQKYHLYCVIQAFYWPFFDVFLTLTLRHWKPAFWRQKFFPLPCRFRSVGLDSPKKRGSYRKGSDCIQMKSGLAWQHFCRSFKEVNLKFLFPFFPMFPKNPLLEKQNHYTDSLQGHSKAHLTPNKNSKTAISGFLKESKSLKLLASAPINPYTALHRPNKAMFSWQFSENICFEN